MGAVAEPGRTDLFRYLTAGEAQDYIAIMGLFTRTLLTDLSAADVASSISQDGPVLELDTVELRCRQLVAWGNLVPSLRDARVSTVAEFLRSRSRYQVSKLGGRVHRTALDILEAADGAREVARELLGQIVDSLDRVLVELSEGGEADAVAGEVTAIFNNQRLFNDSARDFYAYLSGVLSRYDLGGDEYAQFKALLLDYVDLITADVNRHAPAVSARLQEVLGSIDTLLDLLSTVRGLAVPDGTVVERAGGRSREDWAELARWYGASGTDSGTEQLRTAAGQALGQLINNAKRLLDSSGMGFSRRADLLRLSRRFATLDDPAAHRLFNATFVAYPARHLLLGPDEPDPRAGPATSWWVSDPIEVPISLRERGDRAIRGRSSRVPDPTEDRQRLIAQAHREAELRNASVAELAAVGELNGARISPAARELLLEHLSKLLAQNTSELTDSDTGLTLTAHPGPDTVVDGEDGTITFDGLQLDISAKSSAASARRPVGEREAAS